MMHSIKCYVDADWVEWIKEIYLHIFDDLIKYLIYFLILYARII